MLYDPMTRTQGLDVFQLILSAEEIENWNYHQGLPLPFEIIEDTSRQYLSYRELSS